MSVVERCFLTVAIDAYYQSEIFLEDYETSDALWYQLLDSEGKKGPMNVVAEMGILRWIEDKVRLN